MKTKKEKKPSKQVGLEVAIDNLPANEEGRLWGAYIRSLVKHLASPNPLSSNKTTTNYKNDISDTHNIVGAYRSEKLGMAKQPSNPQQQQHGGQEDGGGSSSGHKKQVRRRLHTSRPYQERLLNMAEARKEIVTALKFHRAAMKQANEKKQQQQQQQQHPIDLHHHPQYTLGVVVDHEETYRSHNFSTQPPPPLTNIPYYSPSYTNSFYPWNNNISSPSLIDPPQDSYETLNIPLPNQTLGLNLNLQAFTNLDTTFSSHSSSTSGTNYTMTSMSPSSSSSSSALGDPLTTGSITSSAGVIPSGMHPALDEEEMAEIRSIGEKHQIEWDDTLNLVKSAWWLKFLKTVEFGNNKERENGSNGDKYHPFGELMEFPAWLSANEGFLPQHLEDCCPQDYWKDTTLPWMDIGDLDGLDDEWLS